MGFAQQRVYCLVTFANVKKRKLLQTVILVRIQFL